MGLPQKHLSLLPRDGLRGMTGTLPALDALFQVDPQAKVEIFEDHARFGVNDRFAVIKPTSYYYGSPLAGIGVMSYGLYLMDIAGLAGGYLQVVAPDSVLKYGTFVYDVTSDKVQLFSLGTDLILGTYDSIYGFHVLATLHGGGVAATCVMDINRAGDITFLDSKKLFWSDVNLYRGGVNVLKTDDSLHIAGALFKILNDSATINLGAAEDINLYRGAADVLKTDDAFDADSFKVAGAAGADGSFTTVDGKTVTVVKGLITAIV